MTLRPRSRSQSNLEMWKCWLFCYIVPHIFWPGSSNLYQRQLGWPCFFVRVTESNGNSEKKILFCAVLDPNCSKVCKLRPIVVYLEAFTCDIAWPWLQVKVTGTLVDHIRASKGPFTFRIKGLRRTRLKSQIVADDAILALGYPRPNWRNQITLALPISLVFQWKFYRS